MKPPDTRWNDRVLIQGELRAGGFRADTSDSPYAASQNQSCSENVAAIKGTFALYVSAAVYLVSLSRNHLISERNQSAEW
jgi:hypothetical protein